MFVKKIIIWTVMLVFIFSFSSHSLFSLEQIKGGKLIGFIYKSDKKTPLKKAKVIIENIETTIRYESNETDEKGDYTIMDLPAGEYKVFLEVKDKEYRLKKLDFILKIEENKISNISFALKRSTEPFILKPYGIAIVLGGPALASLVGTTLFIPEFIIAFVQSRQG